MKTPLKISFALGLLLAQACAQTAIDPKHPTPDQARRSLDHQSAELQKVVPQAKRTEDDIRVVLPVSKYLEASQGVKVRDTGSLALREIAEILAQHPEDRVFITGHTDDLGDPTENKRLSIERAERVAEQFKSAGVHPDQIRVRGAGQVHPIDNNATARGRERNRRIELKIDIVPG